MGKSLNKAWRVLATGLAFSLFGIGGVCLSLTVFPYLNWRYPDEVVRKRIARSVVSRSFRFFLDTLQWLGICRYEVKGGDSLNAQAAVVVANHPSLLDVVLLIAAMPKADCVVKAGIWKNPFMRGVVRATCYISNAHQGEDLIQAAKASLDQGYSLIIFPEGTRTEPDVNLNPLTRGAAQLALRTGYPLLPVHLTVEPRTLTKQNPWYRVPERPFLLQAEAGRPLAPTDFAGNDPSTALSAREMTRQLARVLNKEKHTDDQSGKRAESADHQCLGA
ncbi:lysophospholipid acyltransferase family protein [Gallaecimonas kandeliae]|uniref:lysophospholipid acyltransferase family protein n=1 Tax=Gallaecimonas kandeliae TaxID=3029055 RepID=UPI0026491956|nr:lysophospholipid acyltransferase family protein [Gallaecimonas kandeliae]WKE64002.1 lysophospholipid acyltransferase family protein [Gallaecimonas kandeliae]